MPILRIDASANTETSVTRALTDHIIATLGDNDVTVRDLALEPLPQITWFNHQRHIRKEIACEACHGEVRQMDRLQGKRFYMGFCIECHREKKANLGCWLACHS